MKNGFIFLILLILKRHHLLRCYGQILSIILPYSLVVKSNHQLVNTGGRTVSYLFLHSCSVQGHSGSCGCNYYRNCRKPQLAFSVPIPNTEGGTEELPAAERMSKHSQGTLSFVSSLFSQRLVSSSQAPSPRWLKTWLHRFWVFTLNDLPLEKGLSPSDWPVRGHVLLPGPITEARRRFYNWLNVGHRRKDREEAPGR